MKTKLILFDWGNIVESHLTGYSVKCAWNDLFQACGYEGDENLTSHLKKYRLSAIKNEEEFKKTYESMKVEFGLKTTYEEFVTFYASFFDKIEAYPGVADYEKSLKDRCYIGILSDLTIFDKERLNRQVDLSQYDYVFLSYEFGMKKPDMEIFEAVQKQLPFEPQNILFIDDRQDNIESAQKMGWNTFQVTGLELDKIKQKCEAFLSE